MGPSLEGPPNSRSTRWQAKSSAQVAVGEPDQLALRVRGGADRLGRLGKPVPDERRLSGHVRFTELVAVQVGLPGLGPDPPGHVLEPHRDRPVAAVRGDPHVRLQPLAARPNRALQLEKQGAEAATLLVENVESLSREVGADRKSTRLNSSHSQISYAVFCLKKKKKGEFLDVEIPGLSIPDRCPRPIIA